MLPEKSEDELKLIPFVKRILLRILPLIVLFYVLYTVRTGTLKPLYSAQSREIFDAVKDKDYRDVL